MKTQTGIAKSVATTLDGKVQSRNVNTKEGRKANRAYADRLNKLFPGRVGIIYR